MRIALLIAQAIALLVLIARLLPGRTRRAATRPRTQGLSGTTVSVVVASLNEARRIGPCLEGLRQQGEPLVEVIVVDSGSTDGTDRLVRETAARDPRFRVEQDPPLPDGWVGKVWALQHGLSLAHGEWVLGIDADTEPQPGMVAGAVQAALDGPFDVVSFSPCFAGQSVGEQWLQPAMLLTLVYRVGAAGAGTPAPDRMMANGQCFLARRETLVGHGGYSAARASFCDDVTLARHLARAGVRVGFEDGSRLYLVRAYDSMAQMWREWGRSLDLKDATTPRRQAADVAFLWLAQGIPIAVLLALALGGAWQGSTADRALFWINVALVTIRLLMLLALSGSYQEKTVAFWLSPLADPLAALRITISSLRRPTLWRGRTYQGGRR